jgi:LysR family transcriptional regulator for bpeEF and oprC
LLSGRASLDKTCTQRTFEQKESAPDFNTPVMSEWVA